MVSEQQQELKAVDAVVVPPSKQGDELLAGSKLLKVLSTVDALTILSMAKDGIEANSRTYSMVGLSKKMYYTRLMQLKNAGLIEKRGNLYVQTTMGSFVQENCINSVVHATKNRKKMAMIDVLVSRGDISEEDLLQMKDALWKIQFD